MSKLALLGGTPVIDIPKPHFRWPIIGDREIKAVVDQMKTGIITHYSREGVIGELEDEFAEFQETTYALSTNSGTSAIHSALFGCGIGPGDEVLVPAYSYPACVMPVVALGATPVLVEVDPMTGNIDPRDLEARISPKSKGIVIVHMWGHPCEMDELVSISERYQLFLIEDCAHALGATYKGNKVGTFGDVACFSFQGKKIIPAGEGGMLTTNSQTIYERATMLGQLRFRSKEYVKDNFYKQFYMTGYGFKYQIHVLAAVLARIGLEKLDERIQMRNENLNYLSELLSSILGVTPPVTLSNVTRRVFYAYRPMYKEDEMDNLPMDIYIKALQEEGVDIYQPYLPPLHMLPAFQLEDDGMFTNGRSIRKHVYKKGEFPNAERYYNSTFNLPAFSHPDDKPLIEKYAEAFMKIHKHKADLISLYERQKEKSV